MPGPSEESMNSTRQPGQPVPPHWHSSGWEKISRSSACKGTSPRRSPDLLIEEHRCVVIEADLIYGQHRHFTHAGAANAVGESGCDAAEEVPDAVLLELQQFKLQTLHPSTPLSAGRLGAVVGYGGCILYSANAQARSARARMAA